MSAQDSEWLSTVITSWPIPQNEGPLLVPHSAFIVRNSVWSDSFQIQMWPSWPSWPNLWPAEASCSRFFAANKIGQLCRMFGKGTIVLVSPPFAIWVSFSGNTIDVSWCAWHLCCILVCFVVRRDLCFLFVCLIKLSGALKPAFFILWYVDNTISGIVISYDFAVRSIQKESPSTFILIAFVSVLTFFSTFVGFGMERTMASVPRRASHLLACLEYSLWWVSSSPIDLATRLDYESISMLFSLLSVQVPTTSVLFCETWWWPSWSSTLIRASPLMLGVLAASELF